MNVKSLAFMPVSLLTTDEKPVTPPKEKLFGNYSAFLALGMTLLDNEVTFSTCGEEALRKNLQLVTLSQEAPLSQADYLFLSHAQMLPTVLEQAKCGTLIDPHKSATLLILDSGEKECAITLYGAGIDGDTIFHCSSLVKKALDLRDQQAYEYPMGVDLIFVTADGEVCCIPRLVQRRDS